MYLNITAFWMMFYGMLIMSTIWFLVWASNRHAGVEKFASIGTFFCATALFGILAVLRTWLERVI